MLSSTQGVTGSVGASPTPPLAAARLFSSAAPRMPCVRAPHNQQQRAGSVQAGKSGLEKLGAELLDVVTGA